MLPNYQARSPFVLKHTTSIYIYNIIIYICVCTIIGSNGQILKLSEISSDDLAITLCQSDMAR